MWSDHRTTGEKTCCKQNLVRRPFVRYINWEHWRRAKWYERFELATSHCSTRFEDRWTRDQKRLDYSESRRKVRHSWRLSITDSHKSNIHRFFPSNTDVFQNIVITLKFWIIDCWDSTSWEKSSILQTHENHQWKTNQQTYYQETISCTTYILHDNQQSPRYQFLQCNFLFALRSNFEKNWDLFEKHRMGTWSIIRCLFKSVKS